MKKLLLCFLFAGCTHRQPQYQPTIADQNTLALAVKLNQLSIVLKDTAAKLAEANKLNADLAAVARREKERGDKCQPQQ